MADGLGVTRQHLLTLITSRSIRRDGKAWVTEDAYEGLLGLTYGRAAGHFGLPWADEPRQQWIWAERSFGTEEHRPFRMAAEACLGDPARQNTLMAKPIILTAMENRVMAKRRAAAVSGSLTEIDPTPPPDGTRRADFPPEVEPRTHRSPRLSSLVKAVAAAAAWVIPSEQLKQLTVYRLKKSVGTQLQSEPCEGIDGINSDSKTVDELLKAMLNYNKRLYENS